MTQFLPPNLLALFAPRDPIPYFAPVDKLPHEKKRLPYSGVGAYLRFFEDPKDAPPPVKIETRDEKTERKRREKAELQAYKIEQGIALWDPQNNHKATNDPYKTLFVARVNYDTSESKLRREFEVYGPIRKVSLISDRNNNKPRGYAFIEYEHERDMHAAYKHADGKKIDSRRVLVDVERGRTVKGWLPRRLGGGLGNTRRAKAPDGETVDDKERGHSRDRSEHRRGLDRDRGDRRRSLSPGGRFNNSRRRSRSRDRAGGDLRDRDKERDRDKDRDRDKSRRSDRDRDGRRESRDDSRRSDRPPRDDRRDKDRDRDRRENRNRDDNVAPDNADENGQY